MNYKKRLGQNFIKDANFLASLVSLANITDNDQVLEIGAGAGTLTKELSKRARRVVSLEIDRSLSGILTDALSGFPNTEVIYRDALEMSDDQLNALFIGDYKLVANLPYYITTPLIFRFLQNERITEAAVMVQLEVAQRLCASPATPDYGALTVAASAICDVKMLKKVSRTVFFPVPNVDSAFVSLKRNPHKYDITNKRVFERVSRAAFAMRRKTLANNLTAAFPISRSRAEDILRDMGLNPMIRGEALTVAQLVSLSKYFSGAAD